MEGQSRTKNSIINVAAAVSGQGISIIISFIARIIFISKLGEVYLGVNSLFGNIVGLLSLAELGVGTAINYSLYKPLAESNIPRIKGLMDLYRKTYYVIGVAILVIGILLMPFLEIFMKASETNSIPQLHLIFFLFLLNTSVSYFYSFKRALIISDQKRYIATIYRYVFYIVMNVAQIGVLIATCNFILYLIVNLISTIAENICVSRKADKMYPYLKEKDIEKLDSGIICEIKKNTVALLYHKVGSSVVNSTDNILISKIIGIVTVGIYSNYLLITNALNIVMGQLFMALTASIGNMGVTESKEKSERILYEIFFMNFWIDCIIAASLYATVNLLIHAWFGESMILGTNVLVCITINFYIYQIRRTVLTYRDAYGLFWYDRYKALVEAGINLVISIFLGSKIGLIGILTGTIISTLSTSLWVEPYILFKYGFHSSTKKYFVKLSVYTLFTFVCCFICEYIVKLLGLTGFSGFVFGVIICTVIVSAMICVLFMGAEEFKFAITLAKKILLIFRRKK